MNQLVLWNDLTLFWGSNPRAVSEHSHPAIQLVIATQGSFLSKDESGKWMEKSGLLIAPNYFHECNAENIHILSIDIDPESALGEWILNNQLLEQRRIDYPSGFMATIDFEEISNKLDNGKWKELREMIENSFFFQPAALTSQKDERIEKIIDFIKSNIDKRIETSTLMDVAYLSESRLLHLFKEKMGLPIRNYILWYRLKTVIEQILIGSSLTEAAYHAGFSDQAHMTRTCVKMIGIPPSQIVKNSKFVQVSVLE